jgi:AcrR family transcriptional regulator
MSPRPDVSKERTKQILEAAMKVFSRAGFQKASMDDIVAESGLSKGALYWYFKSKDEIIAGILDYMFAREVADIRALPEAEGSAHDRLLRFAQLTLAEVRQMTHLLPITYEFYTLALRQDRSTGAEEISRQLYRRSGTGHRTGNRARRIPQNGRSASEHRVRGDRRRNTPAVGVRSQDRRLGSTNRNGN